ncbi:MAG TPA: hypothetical protein VMV88_09330 [Gallionella sp.]|nr:hypothetical protein [Gallionella sp.]
MLEKKLVISALMGSLMFAGGYAIAADQDRTRLQDQDQTRLLDRDQTKDQIRDRTGDRIYGSQLMTREERNQYRKQIRAAKTAKERERIRAEHHERMKVRAKERGMTLPDNPPARGGMRPGGGMGPVSGNR